jgi:hypothetical protein
LFQGHVRVGRAYLRKGKPSQAVKAFCNAFNALGVEATETQKKEVLKELIKTVTAHMSKQNSRLSLLGNDKEKC